MSKDTKDREGGNSGHLFPTPEKRQVGAGQAASVSWAIKRSRELLEESTRILAESRRTAPSKD